MKVFARFGFLLGGLFVFGGAAVAAEPSRMTWTVNGETREALVFAPAAASPGKVPLIFAFHGHGGSMRGAAGWMRFQAAWSEAVVVYPQGLPTKTKIDPRGVRPGWQREPGQNGDRDLKLVGRDPRDDAAEVSDRRVADLRGRILERRVLQLPALVHAGSGVRRVRRVRGPRDRRSSSRGAASDHSHRGRERRDRSFLGSEGNDPDGPPLERCPAGGEPCGNGCTRYASSKGAPVVTVIDPGGHVFPAWAGERIARFFRAHPRIVPGS